MYDIYKEEALIRHIKKRLGSGFKVRIRWEKPMFKISIMRSSDRAQIHSAIYIEPNECVYRTFKDSFDEALDSAPCTPVGWFNTVCEIPEEEGEWK